tara:strand:- start:145 stop:1494 length:1350 start_codon:yes stop_codon:yes gene_type:complete
MPFFRSFFVIFILIDDFSCKLGVPEHLYIVCAELGYKLRWCFMLYFKKKGQQPGGASGAAGLIALILLFVILYILFLPAGDRAELLGESTRGTGIFGDDGGSGNGDTNSRRGGDVIFEDSIGRIDFLSSNNFDKILPNVFLQERKAAEVIKQFNPIYVKNGVFDQKDKELTFAIDNLDILQNVQLAFNAKVREGILQIDFNGERIFDSIVTTYNVDPVTIDKSLLRDSNVIRISVSGVGARFWRTNEYNLENLQLIGNILDRTAQESSSVFTLTGTEFFNLEEGRLRFIPFCGRQDVGKLTVRVNNRNVFSSVPLCDDVYNLNIAPNILNKGANSVSFTTEKGTYTIEQIRVFGDLKDSKSITRFFEITDNRFDRIQNGNDEVFLVLEFVDDNEDKDAELNVNGHLTRLDTRDRVYRRRITSFIEEGNNFVTISPRSTLYITTMAVELE